MASATAVFTVQRESLGRYIRERKLLLAARDLRDTDQRVYDICLKYGFDSQQTFTASLPGPSISRRAPTAKRTTVAPTEARLSWFNARGKPATPHPAQHQIQWRPALRTTDKTACIELVEIHHMECLNQLLRQRQAQRRRGQQQTGRAGPAVRSRRRRAAFPVDVSCHVNHQLKNILSGKIMLNATCFVFYSL